MTAGASATPGAAVIVAGQLERQNAYLKLRCAQLQEDVTDLGAQVIRLQQELERLRGRRAVTLGAPPP